MNWIKLINDNCLGFSDKASKKVGLLLSGIFLLAFIILFDQRFGLIFLSFSLLIGLIAFFFTRLLTRLLLIAIFFFLILPVGILLRLSGHDRLHLRKSNACWIKRNASEKTNFNEMY